MGKRRVERTKIWDSWVPVEHIWWTFDLLVFNVILESFGALTIFAEKYDFLNATAWNNKLSIYVPCDSQQ